MRNGDADGVYKGQMPDVILVRKCYTGKADRIFELKQLDIDEDQEEKGTRDKSDYDKDYEMFLEELHGDKEMRQRVNIYKKQPRNKGGADTGNDDDSDGNHSMDEEEVRLEELLEDLHVQVQEESLTAISREEGNSFQAFSLEAEEDPDI